MVKNRVGSLHDSKECLEPSDLSVKQKYLEFKRQVTEKALHILQDVFPEKILEADRLVSIDLGVGELLNVDSVDTWSPDDDFKAWAKAGKRLLESLEREEGGRENKLLSEPLKETNDAEVAENRCRKRLRLSSEPIASSDGAAIEPARDSGDSSPHTEREEEKQCSEAQKHQVLTKAYTMRQMTAHSQVHKAIQQLKKMAAELVELASSVKLWVQLNVPKVEDGDNFGVEIQEEAIRELSRVEEVAAEMSESLKYYMARAKLLAKILRFPNVEDYQYALQEVDVNEYLRVKISLVDIRNSYCGLYDLLCKNWEKLVKPRSSDRLLHMIG